MILGFSERRRLFGPRSSQVLVTFALSLLMILGMCSLAVDVGVMYATRASLCKATQVCAYRMTRYISKGQAIMIERGKEAIRENESRATPLDDKMTVTFEPNPEDPVLVRTACDAEVEVPVFFGRIFTGDNVTLRCEGKAVRFPILMSLIIDRSGSMTGNGGSTTIPDTVPAFLQNFVTNFDKIGIYSYSWTPVREMAYTNNFIGQSMKDLFSASAANRLKFNGYTAPADCLRMSLEDMVEEEGYTNKGVKKIVVFMTDGLFNTFRLRPPNVLGAFSTPPPGWSQTDWNLAYFNSNTLYSTTNVMGGDGSGRPFLPSYAGPSKFFPDHGGGFTYIKTNSAGNGVVMWNLDAVISEGESMMYPLIGATNLQVYRDFQGNLYTNTYAVLGKTQSGSGYPEGKAIDNDTEFKKVNPKFRYSNQTPVGESKKSIDQFKSNFQFLSAKDGQWKALSGDTIRAEAAEHALRYCNAARQQIGATNAVTFYTIGFGTGGSIDTTLLMKMANLNPNDKTPPYTPLDASKPYDDSFGFTQAANPAELNRTYIALSIYLATRLTK